jgi:hypothetical protein
MPVQRLPRYEMLLSDLLKHTETFSVDYKPLVTALQQIKEINKAINESKRELDSQHRIQAVEANLQRKRFKAQDFALFFDPCSRCFFKKEEF